MNSIGDRVERAGEVGHDHDGALEHADEQDLAADVVGVDGGRRARRPCRAISCSVTTTWSISGVTAAGSRRSRRSGTGGASGPQRVARRPASRTPPGQRDRALPAPVLDQRAQGLDVGRGDRARPRGLGPALSARARSAAGRAASRRAQRRRSGVSASSASASSRSSPAVRASAATTPGRAPSQHRQHLAPHADPGEARVAVVRVLPGAEPASAHAQRGCVARRPEQRAAEHAPRTGGHPGQRAGAGAAGQPEQHRLGLVVERVPEQHGPATASSARSAAARAGPSPGPSTRTATTSAASPRPAHCAAARGDLRRAGLQAVVDDERAAARRARRRARPRARASRRRRTPPR